MPNIKCNKMKTPIDMKMKNIYQKFKQNFNEHIFSMKKPARMITDSDMRSMLRRYQSHSNGSLILDLLLQQCMIYL